MAEVDTALKISTEVVSLGLLVRSECPSPCAGRADDSSSEARKVGVF